uniref:Uncharacterized protein n=1 Tax=Rhizophora mucronata TaxID=61149 RepID=A0A2P2Q501_RHIMU
MVMVTLRSLLAMPLFPADESPFY